MQKKGNDLHEMEVQFATGGPQRAAGFATAREHVCKDGHKVTVALHPSVAAACGPRNRSR